MGYVIKTAILVALETYDKFIEDVYKIPFTGKDRRQSPSFYLDIQKFLQHLICNNFLYAEDTPDSQWTEYSPLPSELGKEKLPFVFEQSRNLCCDRALELLKEAGMINIKSHSIGKGKCREFALSKEYLHRWFGMPSDKYKKRKDRYIYLSTGKRQRDSKILTEEQLIQKALSHFKKPRHATRHVSRETHDFMRGVYDCMGGLRINLDKLQVYTPKNEREVFLKAHFLQHLAERGCRRVSSVPLVVEYFPEYKLAEIGTRSFEKNGGFQALKSAIKWEIVEGHNYDIKSSQLTILLHELKRYGIKCKRLKLITKKKVMRRFDVDEKAAKCLIYTLVYSLGEFRKHKKSEAFNSLCDSYGYKVAVAKADEWIEFVRPVKKALNRLVDNYITECNSRFGREPSIRNAVQQTYLKKLEETTVEFRRRILSHMIQGIESKAVYEAILENPGVCGSIEHDGMVSSREISWNHPYLELVKKH